MRVEYPSTPWDTVDSRELHSYRRILHLSGLESRANSPDNNMGAYLSTPRTEKDSSDEKNDELVCGASSMQGWRINQEVRFFSVSTPLPLQPIMKW